MSPNHWSHDSTAAAARRTRTAILVLVVLLPAIALAALAIHRLAEHERAAAQALLAQQAVQLADEVDAELQRTVAGLKVLAMSTSVQQGDLPGVHELASRVVRSDPKWQNVQLISPKGEQLVNVRLPLGEPLPPLNRPELPMRAAYTREPVVSDVEMAAVARRMLTAVYVPVLRGDEVPYVLAAAIEPPSWQAVLRARLPEGMHAALLDRFSFVVTNTYADGPAASEVGRALPREPGELTPDFHRSAGGSAYLAQYKAGFSGWTVVTYMRRDVLDARHRDWWILLALASASLLALGMAAALALTRHEGFTHTR